MKGDIAMTTLKEFKESVDKYFNEIINIFIGMIEAFAGIVAITIGFAIWDRRTTPSPII